MTDNVLQLLARHNIHAYGSVELLNFEKHMVQYFEREYERWRENIDTPEKYGVSSFEGEIVDKATYARSVDHYNKDLKIYQTFLDNEYMAYSMAYYGATNVSEGRINDLTLEQAQTEKYKLIVERAGIEDGQDILDIGCGFGGFIKYLFQNYSDITITGINPSSIQSEYIRDVMKFDGSRFNLIEHGFDDPDHNSIPKNTFDRIISIGVLEHFSNFDLLFKYQSQLLKPGGRCLHHLIVSTDTIPRFLNAEDTQMAEYFPGGHIWPYAELKRHSTHLSFIDSWFINGLNYWKTLDEWHRRFWCKIETLYPDYLSISDVEAWNRYFVLSKTMFYPDLGRSYGVGHYLYEKN